MFRTSFILLLTASLASPQNVLGQSQPEGPAGTIYANASLVVVDVVVTDSHQHPVHHLSASDFTLLEDGHPQKIQTFEEHSSAVHPAGPEVFPKLPPGVFTNYSPAPANQALNILLLDRLNTPVKYQSIVHDQLLQYLKDAPPQAPIAIFGLTTRLQLLQGFTSDPELLRAAVKSAKAGPKVSPLMNNPIRGDSPGANDQDIDAASAMVAGEPGGSDIIANLQQFLGDEQAFQLQMRSQYTIDAFNQLGRYLSAFPGRKNLIWFSGSFPATIFPSDSATNPLDVSSSGGELRETMDMLARSQVSVYPIDARGITVPIMVPASSGPQVAPSAQAMGQQLSAAFQQSALERITMNQVADSTGGQAFVNTNDLKHAVQAVVESGSNYYTLAYVPTNHNWNGAFRKIQIKVDGKGLTLAYRRGYYSDDPDAPLGQPVGFNSSTQPTAYSPLRAAMVRGAPQPSEILLDVEVKPASEQSETTVAQGNTSQAGLKGPFRRYSITYSISPRDISCPTAKNGTHHCSLEFVTFAYDEDGTLINMQNNGIDADIPAADFAATQRRGLRYRQEISVPEKGDYTLRMGVHDLSSDRVGAVEIPVSAVSHLKPDPPRAATPAAAPK